MNITGIGHPPHRLFERSDLPSNELVHLASKALQYFSATQLVTSLEPGWEQALAKAAVELNIPFVVALPYPQRDSEWSRELRIVYYELLARAKGVYQVGDAYTEEAAYECYRWQVDHAEIMIALWDYDFYSSTFQVLEYALRKDVEVNNLWQDWRSLYSMRKHKPAVKLASEKKGAQVY